MPSDLNLVSDFKLVRKHHDQAIHNIGDVVLGQQGDSRSHNGDAGQKFQGLDSKSKHQGNKDSNQVE